MINSMLRYPLFLYLCVMLMACTSNDGDIGPYFGTWKLQTITLDGEPDSAYDGNIVWKFQANVIAMVRINDHHEADESIGTWADMEENRLKMDFIYSDNNNPEGSDRYSPLVETHLPTGSFIMQIVSLSSSFMELSYTDNVTGTVYNYKLKKW